MTDSSEQFDIRPFIDAAEAVERVKARLDHWHHYGAHHPYAEQELRAALAPPHDTEEQP